MISNKLELLEAKDCIVICPTRIRPEQAKSMYHTFRKTSTYNSEVIFYIADDDSKLEEYKQELRNCAYIIDKRRTIIEVMNYISCELYPGRKYYSTIGDDNRYQTRKWDSEFIKEIETKGRGWGFAYGNDLLQKQKLCGNPIISGNIIRALGFMALPILKHQFIDNFWTDLGASINRLFYRDDMVQEHLHPFANKGKMDANYDWIYKSGITQIDQAAYKRWFATEFDKTRSKLVKAIMADYRSNPDYKTIGLCCIAGDYERPEVLRRMLNSVIDYVDSINIVFNYKRFKSWRIKKLFKVAEEFKANFCYTKWSNFSAMKNMAIGMAWDSNPMFGNEERLTTTRDEKGNLVPHRLANSGLDFGRAKTDYILVLDADDVMPMPMGMIDAIYFKPEVDSFKCQVYSDTPNGGRELILQHRIFKNK